MIKREKIAANTKLRVEFTPAEIEDVRLRTFADSTFGQNAEAAGSQLVLRMTLDEIEELQGYVAAEANHAKDRKLQRRLDAISDKLQSHLDRYTDTE